MATTAALPSKGFTIHKAITIGFPIYLVIFEVVLRKFFNTEILSFIGPSLAASGLGLIVETLKPKPLSADIQQKIAALNIQGLELRESRDEKLRIFATVFILLCIVVWLVSCASSFQEQRQAVDTWGGESGSWKGLSSLQFILGCLNYAIGIVFSTLKKD